MLAVGAVGVWLFLLLSLILFLPLALEDGSL